MNYFYFENCKTQTLTKLELIMSHSIATCLCILLASLTITSCTSANNKTNVIIVSIGNSDEGTVEPQGWQLAINEINDNATFLPNITLHLKTFYSSGNRQEALLQALKIIQHQKSNATHTVFPIVLGASWSKISAATNPLLSASNLAQISGSSSSIALSNTYKYPYFYRYFI